MATLRKVCDRLIRGEEGAALVEYGMLVGLIAVVSVVAVQTLGGTIAGYFTNINNTLSPAAAPAPAP